MVDQRVKDRELAADQPGAGFLHSGPLGVVDLGVVADRAGPLRPFQGEGVAHDPFGSETGLGCEDRDDLSRGLPEGTEPEVVGRWCRSPHLFGELALRGGQRILVWKVFALGDRPRAGILASKAVTVRHTLF